MKKSALALPAFTALLLSLGGCFGGEDGEDDDPNDTSGSSNTAKLSPGLYVGDYSVYDSSSVLESEFTLEPDGSYRFFWFVQNDAVGDIRGSWFQRDSNIHFSDIRESYVVGGVFPKGEAVENDTNAIREITSTSFERKEWTPLRQKPLWITYRKKSMNDLGDGTFSFTREYPIDSTSSSKVQIDIKLDGKDFAYDYVERSGEDTLDAFQARATWYQVGSIFATEDNVGRSFDTSSHAFSETWDTIPGALMQRIKDVSDTAFLMWSPANFFSDGGWDTYRKE